MTSLSEVTSTQRAHLEHGDILCFCMSELRRLPKTEQIQGFIINASLYGFMDRLCGLVVRVSGYRYRGPGFDPRRYRIF